MCTYVWPYHSIRPKHLSLAGQIARFMACKTYHDAEVWLTLVSDPAPVVLTEDQKKAAASAFLNTPQCVLYGNQLYERYGEWFWCMRQYPWFQHTLNFTDPALPMEIVQPVVVGKLELPRVAKE